MQEDFNVWPPPPKGQSPPQPLPPLRPPVTLALRRLGREALVLVLLGVLDVIMIWSHTFIDLYNRYLANISWCSFHYSLDVWLCAASPFLALGIYKGWRSRVTWAGKAAIAVGGVTLVLYLPLFIGTLLYAISL